MPVEKRRLRTWLDKMIMAVELSLSECITLELDGDDMIEAHARGRLGNGRAIFLKRRLAELQSMLAKLNNITWS